MIAANLRVFRFCAGIARVVVFVAVVFSSCKVVVAEEQILVNIFNPQRDETNQVADQYFDVDVDSAGRLYMVLHNTVDPRFADQLNLYNHDGTFLSTLTETRLSGPLAVHRGGQPLYAASIAEQRVTLLKLPPSNHIPLPFTAAEVEVDQFGNVYVAQDRGNSILKLGPADDVLDTLDVPVTDIDGMAVSPTGSIFISNRFEVGQVIKNGDVVTFTPFVLPGSHSIREVAFDPIHDEVVAARTVADPSQEGGLAFELVRFNSNGTLLSTARLENIRELYSLKVDEYGSLYARVRDDSSYVLGIDPTITAAEIDAAIRDILQPTPKSFDESPEGEYFRGLAARAARTRGNLSAIAGSQFMLPQHRVRANVDIDPTLSDPTSIAIEQINGFLQAVKGNSPLIAGEGPVVPGDLEAPMDLPNLSPGEPFYGRYHAGQPIGFPPPAHVELTLDPATATSNFIKPRIWGRGDLVRPDVISSTISLDFNGLVPAVNEFSMVLGSIDINGTPSGLNRGRLSPSGQLHSQFGRQGRDFEAHVEGWITNDLYTESRPIFAFLDLQGFIPPGGANDDVTVYGTNEPLIVPGLPGQPPTNMAGLGFAATRAEFNLTTNTLHFRENTDSSKTPDLSVILTPEGVFAHGVGTGEPAVGAGISITPLVFTGLDPTSGRYEFADSVMTFTSDNGPFGTALLTDIGIDPETLRFTGELDFNLPLLRTDSPFVNTLHSGPVDLRLLTPGGTLELLTRTANFTRNGMTPTDFIVLGVVPEPSALTLCVAALWTVIAIPRRQHTNKYMVQPR